MSAPKRQQRVAVIDDLFNNPHKFEFAQAVRLIERWLLQQEGGDQRYILDQRLAFCNSLSMSFPASEVERFAITASDFVDEADGEELSLAKEVSTEPRPDVQFSPKDYRLAMGVTSIEFKSLAKYRERKLVLSQADPKVIEKVWITPAFISLLGASGALPIFYTEYLLNHEYKHRDLAPRAFLNIFLHRTMVHFHRASQKYRLDLQYESLKTNPYLSPILSLAGVGQESLRNRLNAFSGGVADKTLAYFAGLLQQRPISTSTIQQILSSYFQVPIQMEQFVGKWFAIPSESQSLLGKRNMSLGENILCGERLWQRNLRVRVTVGPMKREKYVNFLPGKKAALALKEWLTLLTSVTLEYEIRLCLRAEDVRPAQMLPAEGIGPTLGWDAFLVQNKGVEDRSDAGYCIHAGA